MNRDLLFGKEVDPEIFEPIETLLLRAKQDYDVLYLTSWSAPTSGGGTSKLPEGETIRVLSYRKGAAGVVCAPVDYERLHSILIPEEERLAPKYGGYYLVINLSHLDKYFEQVSKV